MTELSDESLQLRLADWERDAPSLRSLRASVFIEEQGVPEHIEWDGRDGDAQHVLVERDGDIVACGRLLPDGRIGRLAVIRALRGAGIGRRVLERLVSRAQECGMPRVYLHAQATAEAFYAAADFRADGPLFEEAGIVHRNMLRELDYRHWDQPLSAVRWPQPFAQLVLAQAQLARRELHILSPQLDPLVFDQPELGSALTGLLRRAGRRARIRIIVADVYAVASSGHTLLQLARRLPSGIAMRVLPEHPDWDGETRVIRDRDSLLRHPGGSRAAGSYAPGERRRGEQALTRFDDLWRAAREDPELRSMSL